MATVAVPKDKLDAPAVLGVNGPEGGFFADWNSIDWDGAQENVRRLRQRIFTASRDGDLAKVRNLQKLMLRSLSNTLVSVRRATEINAGRKTAGADGQVVLTTPGKAELARFIQQRASSWQARPVRRVFIPKNGAGRKRRPLGIPVIIDRCHQARAANALEPEWEARFEARSYGFRPGRGCHDAIGVIYNTLNGKNPGRVWILDADLAAAFDRIDHDHLLAQLGTFPARDMVRQWLKAGVVERGRFTPTQEGTPQGGVISPVLLNVALHGMEAAAGVRYYNLSTWPKGMRLIVRKERPHPGAQLRFTDLDGLRLTCFATNTKGGQLADLELRHRRRARCEDRIRNARDTGLRNLPLHETAQNRIWLEIVSLALDLLAWMPMLALTGDTRRWEPKKLRLRLFSAAAQLVNTGRHRWLRFTARWPWTDVITHAIDRLHTLPNPG
ncbi:transposase [Streptomyces sp. NPDC007901]|uniref:transposase n=1 Tax=Streptomyces sp. NPDC007901 TaxID=3364785 RepID=UPI0036EE5C63